MAATVSVERVIPGGADQLWASVGARFEGINRHGRKTWKTVCTVTASEQGRVFAFCVKAGPLAIAEWRYTFDPVEHATVVVESWTDRGNAWARLLSPLVTGVKDRRTHNRATADGGNRVTFKCDAQPSAVLKLVEPLAIRMGRRELHRTRAGRPCGRSLVATSLAPGWARTERDSLSVSQEWGRRAFSGVGHGPK